MSKRTIRIIIIVVVVVVIVFVALIVMFASRTSPAQGPGGETATATTTAPVAVPGTRAAVSGTIVVPEKGATDVPENVAVPTVVGPAGPATSASFRSFDVRAVGDAFVPDTINVYQRDTVRINMTAVDKDYDVTQPDYGFKVLVPKGATKPIEFGATASGKFTFFCAACGGPEKGPVGYLVVAPK